MDDGASPGECGATWDGPFLLPDTVAGTKRPLDDIMRGERSAPLDGNQHGSPRSKRARISSIPQGQLSEASERGSGSDESENARPANIRSIPSGDVNRDSSETLGEPRHSRSGSPKGEFGKVYDAEPSSEVLVDSDEEELDGKQTFSQDVVMDETTGDERIQPAVPGSRRNRDQCVAIPFSRMKGFLGAAFPGRRMQRAAVTCIAELAVRLTEELVLAIIEEKLWQLGDPRLLEKTSLRLAAADGMTFLDQHRSAYPWSILGVSRQWFASKSALAFAADVIVDDDDDNDGLVRASKRKLKQAAVLPSNQQTITSFFRALSPDDETWRIVQQDRRNEEEQEEMPVLERSDVPMDDNEPDWLVEALREQQPNGLQ